METDSTEAESWLVIRKHNSQSDLYCKLPPPAKTKKLSNQDSQVEMKMGPKPRLDFPINTINPLYKFTAFNPVFKTSSLSKRNKQGSPGISYKYKKKRQGDQNNQRELKTTWEIHTMQGKEIFQKIIINSSES